MLKSLRVVEAKAELWRYQLDRPVGGSGVSSVDVVAVDLVTDQGLTGLGFSYVLAGSAELAVRATRQLLEKHVIGRELGHPELLNRQIETGFNRTGKGVAFIALAAIDVAAWDVYARSLGVPVGIAMGGEARSVPVYGSGGFNTKQSADEAAANALEYLQQGIKAVKPRVSGLPGDAAVVRAVAEAVAGRADVMVDANEKCSASQAQRLLWLARDHGIVFVEEPLAAADVEGYRRLRGGGAVATGEHLQGLEQFRQYIAEGLCAVIQPDLAMAGGLTQSLRVARLAEAFGVEVSPHFLPGLYCHLAAASPSVTRLEDFPLLEPLFANCPRYGEGGTLSISGEPGHGLAWAEGAREAFRVPL
jgi:L-alanine-DL-glutamate epimerase-like enolase superfamily enzyme